MPTGRRSNPTARKHRAERRGQLLDAADRVVRRRGPQASMDDIAAEAGITKPILYKHFEDKGGLYRALAERYVAALMVELRDAFSVESDPRTRITRTIDAYLAFIEKEQEAYRFLMHRAVGERAEAQAAVADFVRQLANEIAVILRDELRRFGLDPGGAEPWAHGMVGMVHLAGDWWLEGRPMPRAQLVDYLSLLLWQGFSRLDVSESIAPGER